jgi:transposase InsO family protein
VSEPLDHRGDRSEAPINLSRAVPDVRRFEFSTYLSKVAGLAAPNRIWIADDITFVETDQGWLYLATVMDLYSRKIVGGAMADHLHAELPLAALAMAIGYNGLAPA